MKNKLVVGMKWAVRGFLLITSVGFFITAGMLYGTDLFLALVGLGLCYVFMFGWSLN